MVQLVDCDVGVNCVEISEVALSAVIDEACGKTPGEKLFFRCILPIACPILDHRFTL